MIYTLNALTLLAALDDQEYARVLGRADLTLADGVGAQWVFGRLTGKKIERVPGIDLLQDLVQICAEEGQRVYFLGSRPGVAERCAQNLVRRFPKLMVAGTHSGYWPREQEAMIVAGINRARADLLLAGLGQPGQEFFLDRNREQLAARVAVGVGGSFDVLSGDLKRAPRWMQHVGLEWLFRAWQEPWRFRRLARLPYLAWVIWHMPKIIKKKD